MIGPAVVATGEFAGVARVVGDHHRTAMRALIMDDANGALGIAHQNNRLAADEGAEIIAGIFHLAFVADVNPGGPENALELKLENFRIGVDLPAHAARLKIS